MANVMNDIKREIGNTSYSVTENGAVGYSTTMNPILDANFGVSSARNLSDDEVQKVFAEAYHFDKVTAMKWLAYVRDVRGGMGERRYFRLAMTYIADTEPSVAIAMLPLVAEYGRWDDVVYIYAHTKSKSVSKAYTSLISNQLKKDGKCYNEGIGMSLLAKWLPSVNASSKETVSTAVRLAKALYSNVSDYVAIKKYQRLLVKLRKALNIVEVYASAKRWSEIDYAKVPSGANLKFFKAFMRHDPERRQAYLDALKKGETKINASVLFPHDIVHKYDSTYRVDDAIEALWKEISSKFVDIANTIVVCDGSGSMSWTNVGNTKIDALEVAHAISIYFSEHLTGEYKDKYITFSSSPRFVDLEKCHTLFDKLKIARSHSDCSNTDIEKVFMLILNVAIKNNYKQSDIPANVLVISDMEFDRGCCRSDETLFESIRRKYKEAGYELPRLVFWNVCSRTNTIPITSNKLGVALVSGFSTATVSMVMSEQTDPYKALLDTINVERYAPVEKAVTNALNGKSTTNAHNNYNKNNARRKH